MLDSIRPLFKPLPGTQPAQRGLFVDRWGTLLQTPEKGYAETPEEVVFVPGALDALFRAARAGWKTYLIGNEDAVAYGALAKPAWERVEAHIQSVLEREGVIVQRNYLCLTRPDAVGGQIGDSVYLLPNTGAFYHALHNDGIELGRSWVVGDNGTALVAGWRSGVQMAAVRTGEGFRDEIYDLEPHLCLPDLGDVVRVLLEEAAMSR